MYYVYGIYTPNQDLPIYIGSGDLTRTKRPADRPFNYNKALNEFCLNNEYTKDIIFETDTVEKARSLEVYLIKVNHTSDILHFNKRAGDIYLEKEFHPNYGKFGPNNSHYGMKRSQETKDKISASKLAGHNSKRFYVTPFGIFKSTREASKVAGVAPSTVLNRCKSIKPEWDNWIIEPKR